MKLHVLGASSLALFVFVACAAPNPKPSAEPAAWRPPAETKAKPSVEPAASVKDAAAAPSATAPAPTGSTPGAAADSSVARIAGKSILVSELLTQWYYLDTLRVRDQLMNLVTSRLALAEAARLHVVVDADLSSNAYEQAVAAMENELRQSSVGRKYPKLTIDSYVDRQLGLDPIRYRERVRDDALRALILDRVTRAWILQQEHAEIRVIVVGSEDEIKAAQQDLKDGKSFEEVALARSSDPSKKDGGVIAPITRNSTPLSKAVFDTPIGSVGSPITDAGVWLLFRVDARPKPIEGDWASIGTAVEESLKKRPIDPTEAEGWLRAMTARYQVDTSPFLELVGETKR